MIDKQTADKLRTYFLETNESIAVAESVTSGLLQWNLSSLADAQKYYQGGITVYNIGQKYKHLHVEPIHAQSVNCVSAKVAEEMAINVCSSFQSNWGIGITGYATPVPESDNTLFCYYCIVYNNNIVAAGKIESKTTSPQKVQEYYVAEILSDLADKMN